MNNIKKKFSKRKVNTENKTLLVQDVFTRVSQKYDLMNDIMSFGFHRLWKKRLIEIMDIQTNDTVIDVGSGTGDLVKLILKENSKVSIYSIDLNIDMLNNSKKKFNSQQTNKIKFINANAETLLIDKKLSTQVLNILNELKEANCEIRGDQFVNQLDSSFKLATKEDWDTEYLDKIISVKIVDGVTEAIDHINTHSSNHTESIITENNETFHTFSKKIDSAIILQNASTQFADGGEFGFGAEIGISTDKLHVRGPVGAEHLTSFKYVVQGNGQIRP